MVSIIVYQKDNNYLYYKNPKIQFIVRLALKDVKKTRRKTLDISQQDLAEIAGIGMSTIKDRDRGKCNLSFSRVSKILDVVGVKVVFNVR